MSWSLIIKKRQTIPKKAERDIKVIKIIKKDFSAIELVGFKYKKGTLNEIPTGSLKITYNKGRVIVKNGFLSYMPDKILVEVDNYGFIALFKRCWFRNKRLVSFSNTCMVVSAIIPKGAEYIIDELGEIISNQIIILSPTGEEDKVMIWKGSWDDMRVVKNVPIKTVCFLIYNPSDSTFTPVSFMNKSDFVLKKNKLSDYLIMNPEDLGSFDKAIRITNGYYSLNIYMHKYLVVPEYKKLFGINIKMINYLVVHKETRSSICDLVPTAISKEVNDYYKKQGKEIVVAYCEIPLESNYFENSRGEIVSDTLIVKSFSRLEKLPKCN